MLIESLHCLAARPAVYNVIQVLAGQHYSNRYLRAEFACLSPSSVVLDLGGGTGRLRDLWPSTARYVCVEPDPRKLAGFRQRGTRGTAVHADGHNLPFRNGCVDVVLIVAVSHHIPEQMFSRVLAEARRVLRGSGKLIFLDAVWAPRRWAGRLLWRYDRGAHPRTSAVLHAALSEHFHNTARQRLAYLHEYVLWVGTPGREP